MTDRYQSDPTGIRVAQAESQTGAHHQHSHHFQFPPTTLHDLKQKFHAHAHAHALGGVKDVPVWVPPTDIRETKRAYHIEIETAGVTDKNRLLIQWMSPRTLVVQGDVKRPLIGFGRRADGEPAWEQEGEEWPSAATKTLETDGENGAPLERTPSADSVDVPTFLLEERKIGPWHRSFTLPFDVDMKALKARLDGGLLRIDLPKRDMSGEPAVKIQVE